MRNNRLKLILEFINSSYGAYMAGAGAIFACSEYDTYYTTKITHELAEKYNPNGSVYINIKNIFMCPIARCNIYLINKETHNYEFITSEFKFIIPPIIKLWDDEFIINSKYKVN